jgi:hypothetical protein
VLRYNFVGIQNPIKIAQEGDAVNYEGGGDNGPEQADHRSLEVGKGSATNDDGSGIAPPPHASVNKSDKNIGTKASNKQGGNELNKRKPLFVRVGKEDNRSSFEERTLKYARLGFTVGVITILLGGITAMIFYDQFKEAANQTDLLDIAAKQTRRDSASADLRAQQQIAALQIQAEAAQKGVSAIQNQTAQEERPWVSADVQIAAPLIFDERGAVTGINVALTNKGRSVAKYASLWTALVVDGIDNPFTVQKKLCGIPKLEKNVQSDYGDMIFPDQPPIKEFRPLIAPSQKINAGLEKGIFSGWPDHKPRVAFHVVVCVDYVGAIDIKHYQTRNIFSLSYPEQRGNFATAMGAFDPNTAYNQLTLTPIGHGASAD